LVVGSGLVPSRVAPKNCLPNAKNQLEKLAQSFYSEIVVTSAPLAPLLTLYLS